MKKLILAVILTPILIVGSQIDKKIKLVEDNRSEYVIVVPEKADSITMLAAAKLQEYLRKISSMELPIVKDNDGYREKSILIGNNVHLQKINYESNSAELQSDGFHIKTYDDHLIIVGGNGKGVLFGVYEFLKKYIGCRKYSKSVEYIPKLNDIIIESIDDKQVPVIVHRELHMPDAFDQDYADWHYLKSRWEREKEWGLWVHTFDDFVPPEKYFDEHPEYFAEVNGSRVSNTQLCLTNDDVFRIVCEELKKRMTEKPEAKTWSVSQNDTFGPCQCEKCRALDEKYSGYSGSLIDFVNRVAAEFPDKVISTLAYQYTRSAPSGITPADNVNIVLCTIECNRSESIATDARSADFRKDIIDWGKLTDNILIWDYVVQFKSLISPFPNFHVLQPNLKFFVDNNAFMMFQQGSGSLKSDFNEMKSYIIAKLLWNPDADVNSITHEFLEGYYGKAAPFINEYFQLYHKKLIDSEEELIIYGYPYNGINSYLTPELIDEYISIFDRAEEAVKDDPEILNRVQLSRLPLEYAILEISRRNVTPFLSLFERTEDSVKPKQEMIDRLNKFVEIADKNNVPKLNELDTTPDEYKIKMMKYFENGFIISKAFGKKVTLFTNYNPKFDVGGEKALTDGQKGINDYYFNWLGFEGVEMEAVIDLGGENNITSIAADFLQNNYSWVWVPRAVEYFVSGNNIDYIKVGEIKSARDEKDGSVFIENFKSEFPEQKARYVKVKTKSLINCPQWHVGYSYKGKAWIFCDEIIVN